MTKSNGGFFYSAVIITLGMVVARVVGMLYKLPLANTLKSSGLGLYQTVFPLYAFFVCICSSSVSIATAKSVSSIKANFCYFEERSVLRNAFRFAIITSGIFAVITFCLSNIISTLQGVKQASLLYKCISPAIVLSGLSGCIRGYYNGKMDMLPSALSEVVSQCSKPIFGIILCRNASGVVNKTALAVVAVVVSELTCFVLLLLRLVSDKREISFYGVRSATESKKSFYGILLPVILTGMILPLSNTLDSFTVVNLLKRNFQHAIGTYGMFEGVAVTVMSIPASLSYGLAVAILPSVSSLYAKGYEKRAEEGANIALSLTAYICIPVSVFVYFYADKIITLLFSRVGFESLGSVVLMTRYAIPYGIFLPLLQTTNSILYAKNRGDIAVFSVLLGVVLKTILQFILIPNRFYGINGYAISLDFCYILAVFINLLYIIKDSKFIIFTAKTVISTAITVYLSLTFTKNLSIIFSLAFCIAVFLLLSMLLRFFDEKERKFIFGRFIKKTEKKVGKVKTQNR